MNITSRDSATHVFMIGHGRAGRAIEQALAILALQEPGLNLQPVKWLKRDEELKKAADGISIAVLANPPGLHANRILEAARAGFDGVLTEKPACTSREDAAQLAGLEIKTGVFHVYRQMWGPQKLKALIDTDFFGEIVSIEGRYWQASIAERAVGGAVGGATKAASTWKNDPALSGPSDVLLDVGTHWIDTAIYLAGSFPTEISGWSSYVNAERPHRDSHVHVTMSFEDARDAKTTKHLRALSSITKNSHGSGNHFEVNIFGSQAAATWLFANPDEIAIGRGRERSVIVRDTNALGVGHPAYHGAGWLEGYVEIARQLIRDARGEKAAPYPTLNSQVRMIEALLKSDILRGR